MRTRLAATLTALAIAATTASCTTVTGGTAARPTTTGTAGVAPTNAPTPPTPTTASDEDQIRQTVTAFQDAYNTQNWPAYTELMCTAMRTQFTGPVMDAVKKGRTQAGLTQVTITSVTIIGDTAIAAMNATNEALGTRAVTLPLKLEDGWKICKT